MNALRDRLQKAASELGHILRRPHNSIESARLRGKIEGVNLALSYLDEERRSTAGTDGPCQDCGQHYVAWWTDHAIWNRVMGGPNATDDPGGLLCPNCFLATADPVRGAWHLAPPPQNPASLPPSIDASPETAPVDPAPLSGPQIANLRPKFKALVMKYVALAWNQGYRVGWDDRNQDDINPLPAGLFHDTPNPYEQEDGEQQ